MHPAFQPLRVPTKGHDRYRVGELGQEARCNRCGEWWPADTEFFNARTEGTPRSWCKGCERDAKRPPPRSTSPAATGTTTRELK